MGMGGGVGLCNDDMRGMRAGYLVYFVLDWTFLCVVKVLRPWVMGFETEVKRAMIRSPRECAWEVVTCFAGYYLSETYVIRLRGWG